MLWIALVLFAFWLIGLLVFHLGTIIYLALAAAVILAVWHWFGQRHRAS